MLINAASVAESLGNRAEAIRYAKEGISKGYAIDDLRRNFTLHEIANDPVIAVRVVGIGFGTGRKSTEYQRIRGAKDLTDKWLTTTYCALLKQTD